MGADNLIQDDLGNQDQQTDTGATGAVTAAPAVDVGTSTFVWKDKLSGDLSKAPLLQKFDNDMEGLNKAFESHVGLEKLLGHDKVPIPKGPEDIEGWNRYSKAMGIPDKAEAYGLPDAQVPDSIKNMTFDKKQFAEIMHAHKQTPNQAQGLWKQYTEMTIQAYNKAMEAHKAEMVKVVNQLKSEWGDAYDTNVELGQMVINKFSSDRETADEISASLLTNPKFIKFLAKIGEQFAENKMPEFSMKRFSLAPEQADAEIRSILADPKHPYNSDKVSPQEHQAAIDYVNQLYVIKNKGRG